MEIERSKERLKAAHRYMLDIRNRAERFRRPEGMTDDDYRRERDRLDEEKAYASADIREAERLFENASHQLVERERGLRDLAKNLPETIRAEFFRSTADPKRPLEVQTDADVSRRLSDVERKLDLILKALEKQGREPGKE
jgi:tryptophan 2,3-dioxygenase